MRFLLVLLIVGVAVAPARLLGQSDANDVPLGDVARNLRKKAPTKAVIDDDNLGEVIQQADSHKGFGSSLRFLMAGDLSGFRVSAPDVTCNLSFSSNVKTLLSSQYAEMDLPPTDLARLEGHASINGDLLSVAVHNATDWHVSEIAVAFTVLNKFAVAGASESAASPKPDGETSSGADLVVGRKPDETVIYRMRAVGVPWAATNFSSRLNSQLSAGEEWHWAIVQARGYPPESYRRSLSSQTAAEVPPQGVDPPQVAEPMPKGGAELTPVSSSEPDNRSLLPGSKPQ
jgi:hypothetical protein